MHSICALAWQVPVKNRPWHQCRQLNSGLYLFCSSCQRQKKPTNIPNLQEWEGQNCWEHCGCDYTKEEEKWMLSPHLGYSLVYSDCCMRKTRWGNRVVERDDENDGEVWRKSSPMKTDWKASDYLGRDESEEKSRSSQSNDQRKAGWEFVFYF